LINAPKQNYQFKFCLLVKLKLKSEQFVCRFIEFVEYHRELGADHFFVADDCSPEPTLQTLFQAYHHSGVMTSVKTFENCTDHKPDPAHTHRVIYAAAEGKCEWLGALDMDEFISMVDTSRTVLQILESSFYSFFRLVWWEMSSEGHLTTPPGLIIDNYHRGVMFTRHVKTIGRSNAISAWTNSHCPTVRHPYLYYKALMSRGNYVERQGPHADEVYLATVPSSATGEKMWIPTNNLFVKHYIYLSLEEYLMQKASNMYDAEGNVNGYYFNGKTGWEIINNRTTKFNALLGAEFTNSMAIKTRARLFKNTEGNPLFPTCQRFWESKTAESYQASHSTTATPTSSPHKHNISSKAVPTS
jgi:hypothetical protein